MNIINLKGKRFGKLLVIDKTLERTKSGSVKWRCKCDCGNEVVISSASLKSGTKSCGCYLAEWNSSTKRIYEYDRENKRIYNIWRGVKARVSEKGSSKNCQLYAKRGIKMCEEWQEDFIKFYNWAINNGYKNDLTLDRIDSNGNYEPNNCRWASSKEQANNRRTNRNITYNGETHTIQEWSTILKIPYYTIRNRLYQLNWDVERTLSTPNKNIRRKERGK